MVKLKVELRGRSYPIFIGADILAKVGEIYELFQFGPDIALVTTKELERQHGEMVLKHFGDKTRTIVKIIVKGGERFKTLHTAQKIYSAMLQQGLGGRAVIMAFGDEGIIHVAGFVAATFLDGIKFIHIPATFLAQVDCSVMQEARINHSLKKNVIGTYSSPQLVWIDVGLLGKVSQKEMLSGLGEAIKYACVGDASFFQFLEENLEGIFQRVPDVLEETLKQSCQIKARVLAQCEQGHSMKVILNFGHRIGQAIEAVTEHPQGEALIWGMLAESVMALHIKILDRADFKRLYGLLRRIKPRLEKPHLNIDDLREKISQTRAQEGPMPFALPQKIGKVALIDRIDERALNEGLRFLETPEA